MNFRGDIWSVLILLLVGCGPKEPDSEALYRQYCGSCHLLPDPKDLPKTVWMENVLPEMGARLGIREKGFDPFQGLSYVERNELIKKAVYPKQAALPEKEWQALKKYIRDRAPDRLKNEKSDPLSKLTGFAPIEVSLDAGNGAFVTFLGFQNDDLYAGDFYGRLWHLPSGENPMIIHSVSDPVVDFVCMSGGDYLTEIGIMRPTSLKTGKVSFFPCSEVSGNVVLKNLHRPVRTVVMDIDQDGDEEIIIGEFGDKTGKLSMYAKDALGNYQGSVLLPFAGTTQIIPQDMNNDGKKDLIVLVTQGEESVFILFQEKPLTFAVRRVVRFPPVYGTSWMEVADLDQDGYQDIVTVQGDNADYSMIPKPYHGLRVHINNGENEFVEKYFYPIDGATRVVVRDFDQDNDMDIGVSAFFPDYENNPENSFVYFQNEGHLNFKRFNLGQSRSTSGRWLTMEAGDYDQDGDQDIVLGSFTYSISSTPREFQDQWSKHNVDLIILENTLK